MGRTGFGASEVQAWLEAVCADRATVEADLAPLLAEQGRLANHEALLRQLLASLEVPESNSAGAASPQHVSMPVGGYVVEHAIEILRERTVPMHINDLHAAFMERGLRIPGAGASANLIVHLRKSDAIASPRRGMYALADIGEPLAPRTALRPTRRRKRR